MIPRERIEKFKALYRKNFSTELNDHDAYEKASKLLRTVRLVYKPITEEELEQLHKRRRDLKNI